MACHVFSDLSEHNLQYLRYALSLGADPALAMPPHRAGPDAYVCALLLDRFIGNGLTLEQMADISDKPCLLPFVTFGKHVGARWSEIPRSYMEWCEKNITDDEDIQHTVKHWLWGKKA